MRRLAAIALFAMTGFAVSASAAAEDRQLATMITLGGTLTPKQIQPQEFYVYKSHIYADRRLVHFYGLNWSGLETKDRAPHGLWEGRTLEHYMKQIRDAGFTAIRLPISPDVLDDRQMIADWARDAGYGPTGLEMLRQTVVAAARADLWVVLSFNSYDSGIKGGDTPMPYHPKGKYKVADWIRDLKRMAHFAVDHPHIAGIDIFNEPYGLSWKQWRKLSAQAGEAILAVNRRVLIFVEGVGEKGTDTGGYGAFWGSNLTEAYQRPIDAERLPRHKLVYSPHVYGPDVYVMPYFKTADYPRNLERIWDTHFGHLASEYALCPGEFGGKYARGSKDATWQDAFISYMTRRGGMATCWFYWQFNPNSTDTGGVLADDWETLDQRKLALLRRLKGRH